MFHKSFNILDSGAIELSDFGFYLGSMFYTIDIETVIASLYCPAGSLPSASGRF